MSATATVSKTESQGGLMAYATVTDGTTSQDLAVFVSPATANSIPAAELDTYLQARALFGTNHADSALALVQPLATGTAPAKPGEPDTRNWAALWVAGRIPS